MSRTTSVAALRRHPGIVRDALAVALATGLYGISFGALSVGAGLDVWQTCALSLLAFTGASQFALVGVLGAGGGGFAAVLTAVLLGTRNTLYGIRLAPLLRLRRGARLAAAQVVIDESTAMSVTRDTREEARVGFLATGIGVFVLWNAFTLVGALAGNTLGDPRQYGLDAAAGGAFLALLWPRLVDATNRVTALLAAGLALVLVPLTPAGVPVLAAATVALGMGLLTRSASDPTEIAGPPEHEEPQ